MNAALIGALWLLVIVVFCICWGEAKRSDRTWDARRDTEAEPEEYTDAELLWLVEKLNDSYDRKHTTRTPRTRKRQEHDMQRNNTRTL